MSTPFKKSVVATDYIAKIDDGIRGKAMNTLARILGKSNMIKKTDTVIPIYAYDSQPKLRRPKVHYRALVDMGQKSWVLRRTADAIIKECVRNWGEILPRFKHKCKKCGMEYEAEVKKCEACESKRFHKPKPEQRLILEALTKNPSGDGDRTFLELIRSTFFYELMCDDIYWSVVYKKLEDYEKEQAVEEGEEVIIDVTPVAEEFYVEHSGDIFPISDSYGKLGGYDYFCPICYQKPENKGEDVIWDIRQEANDAGELPDVFRCPECNEIMVQTAYVQDIGGKIVARFGRNEIVHGSMSRLPPELFGNSKLITLIKVLHTLDAIDDYQLETRSEGKVGGMIIFQGMDQSKVTEILHDVEAERQRLQKRDQQSGELETTKRTALIFIGTDTEGGEVKKIPFLDEAEAKLTLEYYKLYIRAVDQIYGVETTLVSSKKEGTTQSYKMKTEVKRETAQEHQQFFMSIFNDKLLPLFGVYDWIWKFKKLEPKDKIRDAEVIHTKAAAALTARKAGLNVKIDDAGELTIWGEGSGPFEEGGEGRQGLPNTEAGVQPQGLAREHHKPYEISPETQEEQTSKIIDMIYHKLCKDLGVPIKKGDTAKIPVAWRDLTLVKIFGVNFAIEDDYNEIFITKNGKEVPGTRREGSDVNYMIAVFIKIILEHVATSIDTLPDDTLKIAEWTTTLKREYDSETLKIIATTMEENELPDVAKRFDNLRSRLDTLEKPSLHVEPFIPESLGVGTKTEIGG